MEVRGVLALVHVVAALDAADVGDCPGETGSEAAERGRLVVVETIDALDVSFVSSMSQPGTSTAMPTVRVSSR